MFLQHAIFIEEDLLKELIFDAKAVADLCQNPNWAVFAASVIK